jgi:hypothetical protein
LDLNIVLSEQVHSSHRQAESTISDFKIYITATEDSYKNVDGDFDKTVAQSTDKEAKRNDKEEEERTKAIEEDGKRARPKFYE